MLLNLLRKKRVLSPELEITKAQSFGSPVLPLIFMWKTDWDHCEWWPPEACDSYSKYVIMVDEYGNIEMAAGGP